MKEAFCCGVIPLQKREGVWSVLLIKHKKGDYWAFPKGHAEIGETPYQTASRELTEETGLTVQRFLSDVALQEHYQFISRGETISKHVSYFLAEVEGLISLQTSEISSSKWVLLSEVETEVSFKESKSLCRKAQQLLPHVDN